MSTIRKLSTTLFHVSANEDGEWRDVESLILPKKGVDYHRLEKELSTIGIYAPRGLDRVTWSKSGAVIVDAGGEPIVRLERDHTIKNDSRRARYTPKLPPGTRKG